MCVRLDEAANQLLATTLVGKLIGFGMDAKGESERFARPEAGLSIIVATFPPFVCATSQLETKNFLSSASLTQGEPLLIARACVQTNGF